MLFFKGIRKLSFSKYWKTLSKIKFVIYLLHLLEILHSTTIYIICYIVWPKNLILRYIIMLWRIFYNYFFIKCLFKLTSMKCHKPKIYIVFLPCLLRNTFYKVLTPSLKASSPGSEPWEFSPDRISLPLICGFKVWAQRGDLMLRSVNVRK